MRVELWLRVGYWHCECIMENTVTRVNGMRKTWSKNTENLKQVYGKLEKRLAATLVWWAKGCSTNIAVGPYRSFSSSLCSFYLKFAITYVTSFPTCRVDKRGSCHASYYYLHTSTHTLPNSLNSYTRSNKFISFMKLAGCRNVAHDLWCGPSSSRITTPWSQFKFSIGYKN